MPSKSKIKNKIALKPRDWRNFFVILIFFIVGFVIFGNTFGNKFMWDDVNQITSNVFVKDFDIRGILTMSLTAGADVVSNYYRPLVVLTLALEYKIWGPNPIGFHAVNLLLHIGTAALIYFTILSLRFNRRVSFFTAFLFLIHPIGVESVTYIATITELIPVFFIILSIFLFIKFKNTTLMKMRGIYYGSSFLIFILAIFSKESAIVLPVLLVTIHLIFMDRELSWKNIKIMLREIGPFIAVAAVYAILRFTILHFDGQTTMVGTLSPDIWGSSLQFLKALYAYGVILLFPLDLHYRLDTSLSISKWDTHIILAGLAIATIIYFSIRSLKKTGELFFGFSWFFIGLLPVSGIFMASTFIVGIRWLRLPSIGLCFLAAILVNKIWERIPKESRLAKNLFIFALMVYLVFLSTTTFINNRLWEDGGSYYKYLLGYYPNYAYLHNNLGAFYADEGMADEAVKEYLIAVKLDPLNSNAYHNLGNWYGENGQYDKSIESYRKSIELDRNNSQAYIYLSNIYLYLGRNEEAIKILEDLRDLFPGSWEPYVLLGNIYKQLNNLPKARENYEKVLGMNPGNAIAGKNLDEL